MYCFAGGVLLFVVVYISSNPCPLVCIVSCRWCGLLFVVVYIIGLTVALDAGPFPNIEVPKDSFVYA